MGMVADELLAAVESRPGVPYGSGVIPLPKSRAARSYASWEQMRAAVQGAGGDIYVNAAGDWVRICEAHTGDSRVLADGTVVAAVKRFERAVVLSLDEARATGADWFDPRWGWIRGGVKTEREHPENLGDAATQPVTWRPLHATHPAPEMAADGPPAEPATSVRKRLGRGATPATDGETEES